VIGVCLYEHVVMHGVLPLLLDSGFVVSHKLTQFHLLNTTSMRNYCCIFSHAPINQLIIGNRLHFLQYWYRQFLLINQLINFTDPDDIVFIILDQNRGLNGMWKFGKNKYQLGLSLSAMT